MVCFLKTSCQWYENLCRQASQYQVNSASRCIQQEEGTKALAIVGTLPRNSLDTFSCGEVVAVSPSLMGHSFPRPGPSPRLLEVASDHPSRQEPGCWGPPRCSSSPPPPPPRTAAARTSTRPSAAATRSAPTTRSCGLPPSWPASSDRRSTSKWFVNLSEIWSITAEQSSPTASLRNRWGKLQSFWDFLVIDFDR